MGEMSEIKEEDDMLMDEPPPPPIEDSVSEAPIKEKKKKKKPRTEEEKEERRKKKKKKKNAISPEPPEKVAAVPPVITIERPTITETTPVEPVTDQIIVSPAEEDEDVAVPLDDGKNEVANVELVNEDDDVATLVSTADLDNKGNAETEDVSNNQADVS